MISISKCRSGVDLIPFEETLMAFDMKAVVSAEPHLCKRRRGLSEYDKLQAILRRLVSEGCCVEAGRVLRQDGAL